MKRLAIFLILVIAFSCKEKVENKTLDAVIEDVSVADFKKLFTNNDVQLVDVRTSQEYELGSIFNAQLIDIKQDDFLTKAVENLDKSKPVLVYCKAGGRSARAAKLLEENGFSKVYNLLGGYTDWQEKD